MIQSLGYSGLSRVVLMRWYRVKEAKPRRSRKQREPQSGAPQKAFPYPLTMCAAALESVDGTSQLCAFSAICCQPYPLDSGLAFCGLLKTWPMVPSFLSSGVAAAGQACYLPW